MRKATLATAAAVALTIPIVSACQPPDAFVRVPAAYVSYFVVAAKRCPGVLTPAGLAAQASTESGFDPAARSTAGAQGMMQIIPEVWDQFGTDANGDGVADPFTPADSVATSAKFNCYLSRHTSGIDGDPTDLRLAAYNAGLAAVQRYSGIPPYRETEQYVKRVRSRTEVLAGQFDQPSSS